MALLEVVPRDGQPPPAALVTAAGPIDARVAEVEPERLVLEVDSPVPTYATAAVAWSPKWRVSVDGQEVTVSPDEDRLLSVPVPAGRSRVELVYGPDVWDALGRAITLLTLVGLAVWAVRRRRGGRTSRTDAET